MKTKRSKTSALPKTPEFGPIRHLLIDLDGTLLGNRELPLRMEFIARALKTLRKHGGWRKSIGALKSVYAELARRPELNADSLTNDKRAVHTFAKALDLTETEAQEILGSAVAELFPLLKRHFFPIPGALDFLLWAKDKFPMTLATNPVWPIELVHLRLQWAGVDPSIFKMITHARIMHACKPAPEYYREVVSKTEGAPELRPEDCLLVGDDKKMDLPATEVGIRVFILSKNESIQPLPRKSDHAPAWTGSYPALRNLLESEQK